MIFFESWFEIFRVAVSAVVIYFVCIIFVNVFGKRSTATMNNFDWIVTVAVGSILGSSVLLKKVVILEVTTGLLVLLSLQYIFTLLSSRFEGFDKLMKKNPVLLYSKSGYITQNMRRERITIEEVKMNIRQKGYVDESNISAVI